MWKYFPFLDFARRNCGAIDTIGGADRRRFGFRLAKSGGICDAEEKQNGQSRADMRRRFKACAAVALAGTVVSAGTARAEAPPPFPAFSFKRVAPPSDGSARRITVQIGPNEPATAATAATRAALPETGVYDRFWQDVSPALSASTPGRLTAALAALDAQGAPRPRLQALQDIAQAHGPAILGATVGTSVSPALVLAVIAVESSGRADAVSTAGAQGLMQLMPETAARFGVADRADPRANIAGGVAFLETLMTRYAADPVLVLAAYNAGETALADHAGVPPFAETRAYVPKVLAAWSVARGLCLTPPELITDGCALALSAGTADEAGDG